MPNYKTPQLFTTKADDLPLSGQSLLELMMAVLSRGLPFRFKAKGWSMSPFIRDGDVITIAPINRQKPGLGDVVAFTRPDTGQLVVHRIIAKQGDHYLIVGDGIPDNPDGTFPIENLLGCVTRIERDHQRIWLGLGPERFMIAWLSRTRLLIPLRTQITSWRTRFSRKDS